MAILVARNMKRRGYLLGRYATLAAVNLILAKYAIGSVLPTKCKRQNSFPIHISHSEIDIN